MITATIQIGNSDDKSMRSSFIIAIDHVLHDLSSDIHFRGGSGMEWENACWVISIPNLNLNSLRKELKEIREEYRQDSIAFTIGDTELI